MMDGLDLQTLPKAPTRHDSLGERFQAGLNMIPAHMWYAIPTGALTFVNARTADYLGLLYGHHLRLGIETDAAWDWHIALLHPDDHDETRRVWSNCLRTGSAGEMTFRVRSAQGEHRWFITRAEPFRGSDGTLLCWIGINLDIEERKQAEFYLAEGHRLAHAGQEELTQTLRRSEEALRLLVDGISSLVITMTADSRFEFVNQQVLDYFGKTADEMKDWRKKRRDSSG